MKGIRDWFAKLADEHPFVLAWSIVLLVVSFTERLDQISSWKDKFDWILQAGTHIDPATKHVISNPWLFGLILAIGISWIIWLVLFGQATILRSRALKAKDERQTTAYKTLQGMMGAASRIRDRLNPPQKAPQKSIKNAHVVYLISKDFTTEVTREYDIQAVNDTLHYWNLSQQASDFADAVEYLDDINFKVREASGTGEIAYLPTKNDPRDKRVTFYFLPRLEPGAPPRKVVFSFKWPRFMRMIQENHDEEISLTLGSVERTDVVQIEMYLEKGTGKNLECEVSGPDFGAKIEKQKHPSLGWDGFIYRIDNAPPGINRYAFTARLVEP